MSPARLHRHTIDPRASLTVWDSSSSYLTLFLMLVVTVVFIPLIVKQGIDHVVFRLDPGLPLAATFAVLNAMWCELMEDDAVRHDKLDKP